MISCFRLRNAFLFVITTAFIVLSLSIGQYYYSLGEHYHYLYVNTSKVIAYTDDEFLSVALDTSFMQSSFHHLDDSQLLRLAKLASFLAPAYFRLGGTLADLVLFSNDNDTQDSFNYSANFCDNDFITCNNFLSPDGYLIITEQDWIRYNTFIKNSNLKFIFDLNVILRNGSTWNSTNAERLIKFSEKNKFFMDFQLGNEPNSFRHVFNKSISGAQLCEDYRKLKEILNNSSMYKNSKLIGPEVTRPKNIQESSVKYLKDFLSNNISVDVVSWHQYYLNGRTAQLNDFINPDTFNLLSSQISEIKKTVQHFSSDIPIWITETSSAYGSGAPGLSDRYVASFLWLDKLGLAASMGIKVVIRQSLLEGHYALIDADLTPLPDYWISLAFKKLVGNEVLSTELKSLIKKDNNLRFYSHCLKRHERNNTSIVIFGMNLGDSLEYIVPSGIRIHYPVFAYVFSPNKNNLTTKSVRLNGKKLIYSEEAVEEFLSEPLLVKLPLALPSYSIVFWLFNEIGDSICKQD